MGEVLKVIVCGTTFGRVFMQGIQSMPDKFQLVGIVARGSAQAVKCAAEYDVPLIHHIDDIDRDKVDLACVIIRSAIAGGAGTDIANQLLAKGIHVMQEFPVHQSELGTCLRTARQSNCYYEVDGFYADVESVRNFIQAANQILAKSQPAYIDAACSLQMLYPLVDILGKALGGFRPWSFQLLSPPQEGQFCSFSGQIRGIPLFLRVQNQINPKDPDNHMHVMHRITIGTNSGNLQLTDTHGLVLWNPKMHVERTSDGVMALSGMEPFFKLKVSELISPDKNATYQQVFSEIWTASVGHSLCRFRDKILAKKKDQAYVQYQLTACQVWQDIAKLLGHAQHITGQNPKPLGLTDFIT